MSDKRVPMDLSEVQQLIQLMKDHELIEVELVEGDRKVHLKRPAPQMQGLSGHFPVSMPYGLPPMAALQGHGQPAQASGTADPAQTPQAAGEKLIDITSPIIGTFYSAPSPDSDPYVHIGDRVTPDTVVCIVEAMKVMNEMKAECSGTVAEVLLKAGEPVEFGQVMFRVRP